MFVSYLALIVVGLALMLAISLRHV